jgi:acyl-CoA hydrolase
MTSDALRRAIRHGVTVALADGAGMPSAVCAELSERAREVGGVRLITGWVIERPAGLDLTAFADVRTFMAGYGLADGLAAGTVSYVPASLSQLPSLLAGPWHPDVVVISARDTSRGLVLGSEVSWVATAAAVAGTCLVEVNDRLPDAARPGLLDGTDLTVVAECSRPPVPRARAEVSESAARIGRTVAGLVPDGAAVLFGPGAVGEAVVTALDRPVAVDSGIVTDAVVDLADKGLLIGDPLGTYLLGTSRVYDWADGRAVLDRIEVTHDPGRLAARDLVTVNTALQVDLLGQVNVESVAGRLAAGIGGHSDYAAAGSRSRRGLSVIALPSSHRGRPTLVERLDTPVSTQRSSVDVIVTERGYADLRGRSDVERASLIAALFGQPA